MNAQLLIRSRTRALFLVLAALCALGVATTVAHPALPVWRQQSPWSTEVAHVQINDVSVTAEIADTGQLRRRGLSYRPELEDGWGMLFIFPESGVRTFWMYEMKFCLDIIWIEQGMVVGAAQSVCPQPDATVSELERYHSPVPAQEVLEVPAGWMDEHGVEAGDAVEVELPGA